MSDRLSSPKVVCDAVSSPAALRDEHRRGHQRQSPACDPAAHDHPRARRLARDAGTPILHLAPRRQVWAETLATQPITVPATCGQQPEE
ncbi:MAG: hypothetical protein ACR2LX_17150 [Jatrophihabitans sp.]